jgi:hypothetical protein
MNRNLVRKLHKWIFVFMGIFMLAWVLSGLVMILPKWWFGAVVHNDRSEVDYTQAVISPAEAIARLERGPGAKAAIGKVLLRTIDSRLVYEVRYRNKGPRLIDAQNGKPFSFTPELAEKIARRNFGIDAPLQESTRLTEHDSSYPTGQLPVYRVRFSDSPEVSYFVQVGNLRVFQSSPLSRVRGAIVSLHNLGPIEFLTGSHDLRHNMLVATAIISLIGTLAGAFLTLPHRKTTGR